MLAFDFGSPPEGVVAEAVSHLGHSTRKLPIPSASKKKNDMILTIVTVDKHL